jgi:TPR repeat protein
VSIIAALLLSADAPALSMKVEISPAVMALGQKYGKAPSAQFERDLETLEKAGDRTAAVLLGELLMMPEHPGGPDYARSCDHSEAGGQHPEGLQNLATCYFKGSGRPQDLAKARELYRQAAEQGYAKAACAYGNMLIKGGGGPTNVASGLDLCRRAADAGVSDAQADYGGYLLTNQYLPKDAIKARHYLSLAAAQGQANAAFLLGQIYWNGDGVEKNVPQAAMSWITAYDGGRLDAAFLIGNAALSLVVDAARTKQPVRDVVIEQAKKWLGIATKTDPDPKKREHATEELTLLEELLGGR